MIDKLKGLGLVALAACVLAACGGNGSSGAIEDNSGTRGSLVQNPPLRSASLTAADFAANLNATASGQQLVQVAGTPTCGVDFYYLQYGTVDGSAAQNSTTASGVLMVPTGAAPTCSGPRPIVLYAHGTTTDRGYNLAAIADTTNAANGEAALIAAMFAGQGYIVVAPNYVGYDTSPVPTHPYLNADQQSKEMIDALTAAKKAIGNVFASGTTFNGKLFVTGYSQGGHVAMATVRAMVAAGTTVTASAPMSGPYAMEAFGDAILFGSVNIGSTVFMPLITTSYQKAYGNVYINGPGDIYDPMYATGIDTLLPSATPLTTLFTQGKLPQTALFNSTTPATGNATLDAALAVPANPLFALGFGSPNLILNSVRVAYASDAIAHPDGAVPTPTDLLVAPTSGYGLRADLRTNDMRNPVWAPNAPMLLCGGNGDPTVFFSVNTQTMQAFWAALALPVGLITVLDVDSAPTGASDPFAAAKLGFAQAKAQVAAAAGGGAAGQQAVVQEYHGTLVPPFCAASARGFFSQF